MGVKDKFFDKGSFILGDGASIRFWEDIRLSDQPFSIQYASLFNIARQKDITIANVFSHSPLNISFAWTFRRDNWLLWLNLVQRLMEINLVNKPDKFSWSLTTSRVFSVNSMYADYMSGHTRFLRKYIWKLKVLLKIKVFI
jgi:hypothetical protein